MAACDPATPWCALRSRPTGSRCARRSRRVPVPLARSDRPHLLGDRRPHPVPPPRHADPATQPPHGSLPRCVLVGQSPARPRPARANRRPLSRTRDRLDAGGPPRLGRLARARLRRRRHDLPALQRHPRRTRLHAAPDVTARILGHLGLHTAVPPIAAARAPPADDPSSTSASLTSDPLRSRRSRVWGPPAPVARFAYPPEQPSCLPGSHGDRALPDRGRSRRVRHDRSDSLPCRDPRRRWHPGR